MPSRQPPGHRGSATGSGPHAGSHQGAGTRCEHSAGLQLAAFSTQPQFPHPSNPEESAAVPPDQPGAARAAAPLIEIETVRWQQAASVSPGASKRRFLANRLAPRVDRPPSAGSPQPGRDEAPEKMSGFLAAMPLSERQNRLAGAHLRPRCIVLCHSRWQATSQSGQEVIEAACEGVAVTHGRTVLTPRRRKLTVGDTH